MHIAVCDDNTDELSRISLLLEDYRTKRDYPITYETFRSAAKLLDAMPARRFDLLLLDIMMPGFTGMDAARELRLSGNDIPIVFLTSSREFAVESYRVKAENYVIKPAIPDEIFPILDRQRAKLTQGQAFLILKTKSGLTKMPLSNIVYVEVINRKLQFNLVGGEVREAYGYLADYEDTLLGDPVFYKPHRSYVVNLNQVSDLGKAGFVTITGKTVPVARDAFTKAKTVYMKHLLTLSERGRGL